MQVQRQQKVLLCFVATGLANLLVDDQPLPIPFFLSTFISWTSYSLPITHIPDSHSFNEAYTRTSSTSSPLFYESTSSSLLSLCVVYPSLFAPYLTCLLLVLISSHHAGHPLCLVLCISRKSLLRMKVLCGSGAILNYIILSNPSITLQWLWVNTAYDGLSGHSITGITIKVFLIWNVVQKQEIVCEDINQYPDVVSWTESPPTACNSKMDGMDARTNVAAVSQGMWFNNVCPKFWS